MNDFPDNAPGPGHKTGPGRLRICSSLHDPGELSLHPLPALRVLAAEAAELAEDGSNAEPAKHAEPIISLCGLSDLWVE
jgi:hypothetical protein